MTSWSWKAVQFSSVTQLCLTLCDSMDCSMPGFPVHHQLPELAQTHHVHSVSDVIQPSHPLPSPSPPAFDWKAEQSEMSQYKDRFYMTPLLPRLKIEKKCIEADIRIMIMRRWE